MSDVHHTTKHPPRPTQWTVHARARLVERHGYYMDADATLDGLTRLEVGIMQRAVLESWEDHDLNGLGQGVYRDPVSDIRIVVDGDGVVRTVLP